MPTPNEPASQLCDRSCPECGSSSPKFDEAFGYYSCRDCAHVWAHDQDAPEWEDYMDDVELLGQIYDADLAYWAKLIERRLD